MLQIPAGNVRCIRGKGKGARGSTNNKGTPSEGSRGLCWSPLCARSEEQAGSVWHRDTWPRKQGNAQRRFCASPAIPKLCSCQKISAVLKTTQKASGFAKNKLNNKKTNKEKMSLPSQDHSHTTSNSFPRKRPLSVHKMSKALHIASLQPHSLLLPSLLPRTVQF